MDVHGLYALVDMGSNGIRFSISSLASPTARSLPTVYQSRLGISLYDAQYENGRKVPIPQSIIDTILLELRRFKQISLDFGVPQQPQNVRILATEATRNASNSAEYIASIERALGEPWKVDILAKEDEGRIGALGVVSSVGGSAGLQGLMMDLGGGSTQITWLIAKPGEQIRSSALGSVSFPYGAAAMTRLLSEADAAKHPSRAREELRGQITSRFRDAYSRLSLPDELLDRAKNQGLTLYLSGGGFRGWGYLLMSSHKIRPYPIPIINGFSVPVKDFRDTTHVSDLALQSLADRDNEGLGIFRVSKRRAAQVPAVSFLVDALIEAIPFISNVRFCQGGVREGWLYDQLPSEIRAEDPLVSASSRFATDLSSSAHFTDLLQSALPADDPILDRSIPAIMHDRALLQAFANTMYLQEGHSKEGASVTALNVPTAGVLASAHGIGHQERALLALMLGQRWGGAGDLPAPHHETRARLELLLRSQEVWWARYLGVIGSAIGDVYPAGRIRAGTERIGFSAKWSEGLGKKGNLQGVILTIWVRQGSEAEDVTDIVTKDVLNRIVEDVEGLGKKKNRVGGRDYGFAVTMRVDIKTSNDRDSG